ncbi:MAG TPA: YjbE family putative metal transport protein [Dongiaceae bacterium]|jgi:YjbE family integral membrane protein
MTLSYVVPQLIALGQVVIINLVLSGDNAIVVGLAAAGLPAEQRGKVILVGIAVATALRVMFALIATRLLMIIGLTLAGGLLLLWVCWNFWRELAHQRRERLRATALADGALTSDEQRELSEPEEALPGASPGKTMRQAIVQIVIADVSMSLDNVLAIAGAASRNMMIMVVGLVLSVAMMGVAANFIARLLQRFHWIAYGGLAIILWVALDMIYRGSMEVVVQGGVADMIDWWH